TSPSGATPPTGSADLNATGVRGTFSVCLLEPGPMANIAMCTSTFTPSATGTAAITGSYGGDADHGASSTTSPITITISTLPIELKFTSIDAPGSLFTASFGINDNGQIVGSYSNTTSACCGGHGFLLSGINGSFTTFDHPNARWTIPRSI